MTKTYDPTVGHGSLLLKVMNYREKPYDELPEELKTQVKRACNPSWDNLNADERLHSALMHDRQNDQDLEEAVCWELDRFLEEAEASEGEAREEPNNPVAVKASLIWGDVQDRIKDILDDRARVGAEIQELKRKVSDYEKLENEVSQLRVEIVEFQKNNKQTLTTNTNLSDRAEITYLNIIGAMLDLLLGETPSGNPYSTFTTQADIIKTLEAHHNKKQGISKRNLEEKFADANRQLTKTDDG